MHRKKRKKKSPPPKMRERLVLFARNETNAMRAHISCLFQTVSPQLYKNKKKQNKKVLFFARLDQCRRSPIQFAPFLARSHVRWKCVLYILGPESTSPHSFHCGRGGWTAPRKRRHFPPPPLYIMPQKKKIQFSWGGGGYIRTKKKKG